MQQLPEALGTVKSSLARRGNTPNSIPDPCHVHGPYDQAEAKKRALVSFSPQVWHSARSQWPHIRHYNYTGLVHSLVTALQMTGHAVDMIDPAYAGGNISNYDIFLGHGGHCGRILDQLDTSTKVYEYVSGAYWESFIRESDERYARFYGKHDLPMPADHRRSMRELCAGHEQLHTRADVMFTINCPRMVANYGRFSSKFQFTGLGAYPDPLFIVSESERNHRIGRNNFIYVGGTGGNLQKGLDVLLEAFASRPHLQLYIYCKVESEILIGCRRELDMPNIHYIYHWRIRPFQSRLRELLPNVSYTVHAPMNFGMGTAFMASLGSGLIPCGYVDMPSPLEGTVLAKDWHPEDLANCLDDASSRCPEWCREASKLAKARYHEHCDPSVVEDRFKAMFRDPYPQKHAR